MSIAAISFLSLVSCVRVALPLKVLMMVLLNGPLISRSGLPPCAHAAWIIDLTRLSLSARWVPESVAAVVVVPFAPPAPRATFVAYQPQSGRSCRGTDEDPAAGAWLPVRT